MSDTRDQIRRCVHDIPGIHFSRVSRELDLATGQVQYHLYRLIRADKIVSEEISGQTHYFAPDFDPWERHAIAFLQRETPREIIVRLHANGPTRPKTLASDLDLARSTIAWHVSNLVEHGIVEKSDATPMTLSLTRTKRTAALLDAVSPSLPDRVVDRFVRTVDQLLE
jgi:predicted transcriptional regulator